jgi:hypothetical protein
MAAPPRTTPTGIQGPVGATGQPGSSGPQVTVAQPDLPGSFRGLMTALGVGLPHGLNRATAAAARLRRQVRRRA